MLLQGRDISLKCDKEEKERGQESKNCMMKLIEMLLRCTEAELERVRRVELLSIFKGI